jgi:hypothetical protein
MVWSSFLARGALHPGKAGNHTPEPTKERRKREGKRDGERAGSRERGARPHPPPWVPHTGWRGVAGGFGNQEEQGETNRSVDRSGSDKRLQIRSKRRLTPAQSRCILWVEQRQSSTLPVRCVTTEAGFPFVQVCTAIGHLLIVLNWAGALKIPSDIRSNGCTRSHATRADPSWFRDEPGDAAGDALAPKAEGEGCSIRSLA